MIGYATLSPNTGVNIASAGKHPSREHSRVYWWQAAAIEAQ